MLTDFIIYLNIWYIHIYLNICCLICILRNIEKWNKEFLKLFNFTFSLSESFSHSSVLFTLKHIEDPVFFEGIPLIFPELSSKLLKPYLPISMHILMQTQLYHGYYIANKDCNLNPNSRGTEMLKKKSLIFFSFFRIYFIEV